MHPVSRGLECPKYTRLIQKKTSKSPVWIYYGLPANDEGDLVAEDVAICKLCRFPVSSRRGSTTNLMSHIKLYHASEFSYLNKAKSVLSVPTAIKVENITQDTNPTSAADLSEMPLPKKQTLLVFQPLPSTSEEVCTDTNPTSAAGLSEMPPPKKQKTLLVFQPLPSTSEVCTAVVAKFIATTMQPFNIVECQPFVEMVKTLNPQYTLPGRKYFSKTLIPKLFNETKQKIKSDICLTRNDNVSITTDCWTSASYEHFITITAHYINDNWELKSPCLCCVHFNDDHTTENIFEILQEKLSEWNLNINQLYSCTTDNSANILKAISLSDVQHVPCFGHTINIGINKALKIQILSKALSKLKKLQNSFAHSLKMSRDLSQAQELMQMKTSRLPSACPTRWESTLKMCKRFLDNQHPISKVLFDYPKKFLMLEQNEVSALEDFVESTTLMEDITKHLSGEEYTTASSLVPLLQKIKKRMQPKDTDRRLVKGMKSEILSALDEYYFECSEVMELLNLTTACDPRFRLNYADNKEEVKTVLLQHMLDVYEHSANKNISDNSENKNPKCGLEKLLDSDSDDEDLESKDGILLPVRKVEIELKNYLSMPKTMLNQDPLTWWKSHGESFPSLRIIAKKLLAAQGTSVPSERVFSAGDNMITQNRASLLPKYAEMQVLLAHNRNII